MYSPDLPEEHLYWDTNSTIETAGVNGKRFVEYCRSIGVVPRFSGIVKDKGLKRVDYGDFTGEDGYWKLLIDRRMYDRNGKYYEPKAIDVTGITNGMIPMQAEAKYERRSADGSRVYDKETLNAIQMTIDKIDAMQDYEGKHGLVKVADGADGQKTQLQVRDQEYMEAVESGDNRTMRTLVEQAAIDAGAAVGENGMPLRLFHGTPREFGFTKFRDDRVIFTTTSESVAHGYANFGSTKRSDAYTEYDGTEETLIKNAKNVLGMDAKKMDRADVMRIHDKMMSIRIAQDAAINGKSATAKHLIDAVLTGLPEKMDTITWTAMWEAVKREQAAKLNPKDMHSEEFLNAVGRRLRSSFVVFFRIAAYTSGFGS